MSSAKVVFRQEELGIWDPPSYQRFPSSYRKFIEEDEIKFQLDEAVILSTEGSQHHEEVDGTIGFVVEILSDKRYKVYWEKQEMVIIHQESQLLSADK
jgi:Uma2 family endonuclease